MIKILIFFLFPYFIISISNIGINNISNYSKLLKQIINYRQYINNPLMIKHLFQNNDISEYKILLKMFLTNVINLTEYGNYTLSQYKFDDDFFNITYKHFDIESSEYDNETEFFFVKFIIDSSKSKDDISNYRECVEKYYIYNNFTEKKIGYYLVTIDKRKNALEKIKVCNSHNSNNQTDYNCTENNIKFPSLDFQDLYYTFGICFPLYKNVTNLEENFKNFFIRFSLISENIFDFQNKNNVSDELSIIIMNSTHNNSYNYDITKINLIDFIQFIPIYIIIIIIIFMIVGKLPNKILKEYFIKFDKNNKELKEFEKNFFLKSNWNELFNYLKPSNKINNDTNLQNIKGIKGISIIFTLCGFVFFILFNSPVFIYSRLSFRNLFKSFLFPFFNNGLRIGPRILLSCSGYILFYKFLCFLDNKKNNLINFQFNEKKNNKIYNNESDYTDDDETHSEIEKERLSKQENNDFIDIKINEDDIKISFLFQFYFYQIHKYIFYILVLLFCLFSLPKFYKIESLLYFDKSNGVFLRPIWKIFNVQYIDKCKNIIDLFLAFFSLFPFKILNVNESNYFFYFWLFNNEVIFFIITSFIIFIGFKYKLKIDIFFFCFISISILIKIIFHFSIDIFSHEILYFYNYDFGSIFINPIYNYDFYLIGVIFGMFNYIIQKDIKISNIKEEKPFLIISIYIVNFLKNKNFNEIKIISLFIFFVICLKTYILFIFDTEIIFGKIYNLFLCIDIEIIVFLCHFLVYLSFINYNNFINHFCSNNFWLIFHKLYNCFIILINPITSYLLFFSELRINLNVYNCIFYSLISGFFVFCFAVLCYIFFELPSKRIVKLILSDKK